jgi:hypothetical protein
MAAVSDALTATSAVLAGALCVGAWCAIVMVDFDPSHSAGQSLKTERAGQRHPPSSDESQRLHKRMQPVSPSAASRVPGQHPNRERHVTAAKK